MSKPSLSVVSSREHRTLIIKYGTLRRLVSVLCSFLALAGTAYWAIKVLPNANVQPVIGYTGLAALTASVFICLCTVVSRWGTWLELSDEVLKAKVFRVFGFQEVELFLKDIRTIGYIGQGEAPTVLVTMDDKTKTSLPGLLFWDRPELLELLRERVEKKRAAVADSVEFPKRFHTLPSAWLVVIGVLVVTGPLAIINLVTQTPQDIDFLIAGIVFLLIPLVALMGLPPFVSYSSEGKVITRKPWFRPRLKKTIDLRDANAYFISGGPRRKLHLVDQMGFPLATFELSSYDFSSVMFWAERALEKIDKPL